MAAALPPVSVPSIAYSILAPSPAPLPYTPSLSPSAQSSAPSPSQAPSQVPDYSQQNSVGSGTALLSLSPVTTVEGETRRPNCID